MNMNILSAALATVSLAVQIYLFPISGYRMFTSQEWLLWGITTLIPLVLIIRWMRWVSNKRM